MDQYTVTNQRNWDGRVAPHVVSESYNLAGFRKTRCSLMPLELQELGNVQGKTLLHLQCHFGMDTLSWAERGAQVTGVDLSGKAIRQARQLATELAIEATFIQSDVYAVPEHLDIKFDIVYTSYGVLCWLGDLSQWAQIVADALKPGGLFYIVESHPAGLIFSVGQENELRIDDSYFNVGPQKCESGQSYIETHEQLQATTTYQWSHSLGEIVTSIIDAGLQIQFLHEFPFAAYQQLPTMEMDEEGWWRLPSNEERIPFLFSLLARKPA
ncbi:MAG: class I SAM-dependent methyltransferase [Chloroflexota bacterium]